VLPKAPRIWSRPQSAPEGPQALAERESAGPGIAAIDQAIDQGIDQGIDQAIDQAIDQE
jgi:hypothetical protein